ncbi:MAG: hypothetical protein ACJ8C4_02795 [Gemmataceae bacterium]
MGEGRNLTTIVRGANIGILVQVKTGGKGGTWVAVFELTEKFEMKLWRNLSCGYSSGDVRVVIQVKRGIKQGTSGSTFSVAILPEMFFSCKSAAIHPGRHVGVVSQIELLVEITCFELRDWRRRCRNVPFFQSVHMKFSRSLP